MVSIVIVGFVAKSTYEYYFGFDKETWQGKSYLPRFLRSDYPREDMIEDVIAHELKTGMSKQEVIEKLGSPSKEYPDGESIVKLVYFIGGGSSSSYCLVVELTKGRVVQRYVGGC